MGLTRIKGLFSRAGMVEQEEGLTFMHGMKTT